MVATESHILLLLRSSDCFVTRLYPFEPNKLYCLGVAKERISCFCVSPWKMGALENSDFFFLVTEKRAQSIYGTLVWMQCFPSIETREFQKGLLSNIAISFNRGRKSHQPTSQVSGRVRNRTQTPARWRWLCCCCHKPGFSSDSRRGTFPLQIQLCRRGPAGGKRGVFRPVLPPSLLH